MAPSTNIVGEPKPPRSISSVGVGFELFLVLGQRDFAKVFGFVEAGFAHDIAQHFVLADVAIAAPVSLEHAAASMAKSYRARRATKAPRIALTELTGNTTSSPDR